MRRRRRSNSLSAPGETQTQTFNLKTGVQNIGIVALYRDIDHAQWRAMAPAATTARPS